MGFFEKQIAGVFTHVSYLTMITETQAEEPKTRGDKTPKHELESRILKVVSMIEEGQSRAAIVEQCCAEYSVSRSTVDRYIESANEHFKETYKPHLQRSAEIAKRRLEAIFQKSMKKEDYRMALAAQSQLNKIQGLCDNLIMARIRMEKTI